MADGSELALSDLLSSSISLQTGEIPLLKGGGEGMSTSEGDVTITPFPLTPQGIETGPSRPLLLLPEEGKKDTTKGVPRQLSDLYPGVDALFQNIGEGVNNRIGNGKPNERVKNKIVGNRSQKKINGDNNSPPLLKLQNNIDQRNYFPCYRPFLVPPTISSTVAPPIFLTARLPSPVCPLKPTPTSNVPRPLTRKEWVELVLPSIPTRPFVPKLLPPPHLAPPLLRLDDPLSRMRTEGFKLLTLPVEDPDWPRARRSQKKATPTMLATGRQRKRRIRFKSPPTVTMDTVPVVTKYHRKEKLESSSDETPSSPVASFSNKPRPPSPTNEPHPTVTSSDNFRNQTESWSLPSNKPLPPKDPCSALGLSSIQHVNISTTSISNEDDDELFIPLKSPSRSPSPSHVSHTSPTHSVTRSPSSPSHKSLSRVSPLPSHRSPSLSPPLITASVAIQVDINEPHPPDEKSGRRLYTEVVDIEDKDEEEAEEEVVVVTDNVARTPPAVPRRHGDGPRCQGNGPFDAMRQFELLEKQLSLLEHNAEDMRDDFKTSRRILHTIDRLTPSTEETLTPADTRLSGPSLMSPPATPRYRDNSIGGREKSPMTLDYKKWQDNSESSPLKEKFNSDGNESNDGGATGRRNEHDNNNNKKSHLRRWMSKRFIERNAEYKSHREELRMKEKRPYKTLSTSSTPRKSTDQKRAQDVVNRQSRLREAQSLMDDLLHSNSLLSSSLKHQPGTDDDEWKRKTKNEKRKEKENNREEGERRVSRSAYHSPARGRGLGGGGEYSKRRIASVEGLTLREQEKMAEILATFKNERDNRSASSVDWDEVDEIMAASS